MIKPTNEYETAYTKDIPKWNFMYQAQTTGYVYKPCMPNRIEGAITSPEGIVEVAETPEV